MSVEVKIDDAAHDQLFSVLYDESATPQQVWDAVKAAGPTAVDAAMDQIGGDSYLNPAARYHFAMAVTGHLYASNILDRVAHILGDPELSEDEVVSRAVTMVEGGWSVMENGFRQAVRDRDKLAGS